MKPNTPTLAITSGLISRSSGPIRRYHCPINIAVQPCAALLGFTYMRSAQPTELLRTPERAFVFTVVRKLLSKCYSNLTL
jgi:hypothetical protein